MPDRQYACRDGQVLEMLNNSISVVSPEGFLDVQHAIQDDGTVKLITSYKNREGLFDPEAITLRIGEATEIFENGAGNEARIVKRIPARNTHFPGKTPETAR